MIKGFWNLPWLVWAALALVLAVIWVFVGPHQNLPETGGLRYWVVRWGHALTWLLLAISFAIRGLSTEWSGPANLVALAAGAVYALFLVMTFVVK